MPAFQSKFHIRDLEQFTGIKTHTIRAWERRYGLLKPDRTDTNIRTYDLDELRVVLNVAYLKRKGHKISRIAAMSTRHREELVQQVAGTEVDPEGLLDSLVLAMLGFDEVAFERTCEVYTKANGFRALMEDVISRFLQRIGILWQTSAICPAQEHFASNLIRRRILTATAGLPNAMRGGTTYVLFLPENEVHEIGLLYADHVLRSHGHRTIYLGQSVPFADLDQVTALVSGPITFVGMMVMSASLQEVKASINALGSALPKDRGQLVMAGAPLKPLISTAPAGVRLLPDLAALIAELDTH